MSGQMSCPLLAWDHFFDMTSTGIAPVTEGKFAIKNWDIPILILFFFRPFADLSFVALGSKLEFDPCI